MAFIIKSLADKFRSYSKNPDANITTIPDDAGCNSSSSEDSELLKLFESWMLKHGKIYDTDEEKLRRFEIFKDNKKLIDETNNESISQGRSLRLGLNLFADLTSEEFHRRYTGYIIRRPDPTDSFQNSTDSSGSS